MLEQVLLAGFGGQGVLSMGQFLASAALVEEKNVSWLPSYGPEMRGGTANCQVIVSDKPIASPIISRPSTLIVMNRPSLDKFVDQLMPGGLLLINSSLIDVAVTRTDIEIVKVDTHELAVKAGNAKAANMVMLGAYLKLRKTVEPDAVVTCMQEKFTGRKATLVDVNKKALELGMEAVK